MRREKQPNNKQQKLRRSKVEEHLRRHLGDPAKTWVNDLYDFKIYRFDEIPCSGGSTYTTLGLSDFPLVRPTGVESRQEISLSCYSRFGERHIEDLLFVVGGDVAKDGQALRKGQIIGPAGPLVTKATVEALFCTSPPFLPEDFDQISMPTPVVIVGLMPITRAEAAFATTHGWSAFEDAVVEGNPDILDLERKSVDAAH